MTARHRAGFIRRQRRREKRRSNRIGNAHPAIASGSGFGAFNFAALVFLLLARHSPQAVSARAACVGCHQKYRESRDDVAGVLYLFSAKSTDRSLRLVLFAAFWSAKSGAKTDPPTKKAERRGLTLAPGDYSRVCKQTVPSARAFRPPCVSRLRHRVGISLRLWRREADAITPFRKNHEKLRIYQTYPLRLISANVARTQAARSEGATLSCRPRTPALT